MQTNQSGALILVETVFWPNPSFRPLANARVPAADLGEDGLLTLEAGLRLLTRVCELPKSAEWWGPEQDGFAGGFQLRYSDNAPRVCLVENWIRATPRNTAGLPAGVITPETSVTLKNGMSFWRETNKSIMVKPLPFLDFEC